MVKKLIVICLIGLIGLVSLPSAVGAYGFPSGGFLLAQTDAAPQAIPSKQLDSEAQKDTARPSTAAPAVDQQPAKQKAEQSSFVKKRSQNKPFNPYNMEALKRFDAGSHRRSD